MFELRATTPDAWVEAVMTDFDTFLLDHAANERKASASAMSLVAHYPDRVELVDSMIKLAQEELEHFRQAWFHIRERGLILVPDVKDRYVRALAKTTRNGTEVYFLDRLVLAAIIEARGFERFGLVHENLEAGPLKDFYKVITRSEQKHAELFEGLARMYFDDNTVTQRFDELLDFEAKTMLGLPIRAALH